MLGETLSRARVSSFPTTSGRLSLLRQDANLHRLPGEPMLRRCLKLRGVDRTQHIATRSASIEAGRIALGRGNHADQRGVRPLLLLELLEHRIARAQDLVLAWRRIGELG